jgi:hypothetical protein
MTPCVVRDGAMALSDPPDPVCVGCSAAVCPGCRLPVFEHATQAERDERAFCSPLRCDQWTSMSA